MVRKPSKTLFYAATSAVPKKGLWSLMG